MSRVTRFFVDPSGIYLGGWQGPAAPPAGAIEVPSPPDHATQAWSGTDWNVAPASVLRYLVPKLLIVERLHAAGKLTDAVAALAASSLVVQQRWAAATAIYNDDVDAHALVSAIGANTATILAPED